MSPLEREPGKEQFKPDFSGITYLNGPGPHTYYGFEDHDHAEQCCYLVVRALQTERWAQFDSALESYVKKDGATHVDALHDAASFARYSAAISKTIERFGNHAFQHALERFFLEGFQWLDPRFFHDMISSLKSGAATEPDQRYLDYTMLVQHADFGPIPEGAADLVEEIIGAPTLLDPRITDGTWKLVNVTPAWGDVWFWRALHEKYPPIENALADFLLNLAQANPEGMSVNTRYDRCIIFPREVLKFMFNPAYEHLTRFFPGLRTNAKGTEGFEKALQIIH